MMIRSIYQWLFAFFVVWVIGTFISSIIVLIWLLILSTGAYPHEAVSGWAYPPGCCSNKDCREIGDAFTPDATIRVFERPEGYVISTTGEVIPMTSNKVRNSPDGRFHWCSRKGADDGETICLFVPPRAY